MDKEEIKDRRFKILEIEKKISEDKKDVVHFCLIGTLSLLGVITGYLASFNIDSLPIAVLVQLAGVCLSPFAIGGMGIAIGKICDITKLKKEDVMKEIELTINNEGKKL